MTGSRMMRIGVAIVTLFGIGCGGEPEVAIPPQPGVDALGLSEAERERYAPITFDKLVAALEIAEEDRDALETVISRVNGKWVGWSGVVKSTRIVKPGREISEYSLNVASPSQANAFVPKTVPILFTAPTGDPISQVEEGTPIVFVGRLEFDGFSRDPWVLDARLVE